jgi:GMP synthase (glutamine-hydrolysing)
MPNGSGTFIQGVANDELRRYGVQWHPEMIETPEGKILLENLAILAGHKEDWEPGSMIDEIRGYLDDTVPGNAVVAQGFSSGVDSSLMAAIAYPVLKDRLKLFTIDAGHLREGEPEEIIRNGRLLGPGTHMINAQEKFLRRMALCYESEEVRKRGFIPLYEYFSGDFAKMVHAIYFMQGSLAPDFIESGKTGGDTIKTHHNVAEMLAWLTMLHPLRNLFKYEVRALARELGLPEGIVNRHPSPGPGLFLDLIRPDPGYLVRLRNWWLREGAVQEYKKQIEIVRWSRARVEEILRRHKVPGTDVSWFDHVSQIVVGYADIKTTGVKGDKRRYTGSALVRAVLTSDFITVRGVYFPEDVWREIEEVLTRHKEIVRAWPDPSHKPPGTTIWQ